MLDFAQARRTMVDSQLRTFDVTDRSILNAMGETPREHFMPAGRETLAYSDLAIPLTDPRGPEQRVMLAPMVLARLIQALELKPGARVLDVASGLGYASAVMARLGMNVVVKTGPLLQGCSDDGPFDAILVNGALTEPPQHLLAQLKDGGRLACLGRGDGTGKAVLYVRSGDAFGSRFLFEATAPELAETRPEPSFVF
jgi:protein-L-isoaspartate(D-aspartate) O-methyltransferase